MPWDDPNGMSSYTHEWCRIIADSFWKQASNPGSGYASSGDECLSPFPLLDDGGGLDHAVAQSRDRCR